jgi:hypothetical protein
VFSSFKNSILKFVTLIKGLLILSNISYSQIATSDKLQNNYSINVASNHAIIQGSYYDWNLGETFMDFSNKSVYINTGFIFPYNNEELLLYEYNLNPSEKILLEKIRLFPNPTFGKIYINKETKLISLKNILVINISGQIIKSLSFEENEMLYTYTFSIEHLSKGIYWVKIILETLNKKPLTKQFKIIKF